MTGAKFSPIDREAANEILLKVYSDFFEKHPLLKRRLTW